MNHVGEYKFPVAFDFPAGHIPDNHALIFGRETKIDVTKSNASLQFI
jgi:muramoyltetrapeptide carboxypeptidase